MTKLSGPQENLPIRVAICDDHEIVADAIAQLLDREPDLEVVGIAHSASELMTLVSSVRLEVVLIDYELPDLNGVEATKVLKTENPDLKVVMLTSYANEDVLVAAMGSGCSGFITKHGGATQLVGGVRMAAAGEALISRSLLEQLLPRLKQFSGQPQPDLTSRELEVLELLAEGGSTQSMADRLFLSTNTVRNHIQSLLSKLGAHSRLEAVTMAARQGLIRRGMGPKN